MIDTRIPRDLVYPRPKRSPLPERLPVSQDPQKHFLHKVLAKRPIPGELCIKVVQRRVVPFEQHP
jgi:hypothetical protein